MTVSTGGAAGNEDGAVRIPRQPPYVTVVWVLLLLLGAFFLFAVVSDLAADARSGIPNDHTGTFTSLAGTSWDAAKGRVPGEAHYVTLLEVAYAFHELNFAVLYLAIVAIPFRKGMRWAWWACWAVEIANLTYLFTFGAHDATIFVRALIAAVALPVLLFAASPWFSARDAVGIRA